MPRPPRGALKQTDAILIVDDRPFSRRLLDSMLQMLDYRHIHFAANEAEVCGLLASQAVGLVLLDWHLPGTTSAGVLDAIRSHEDRHITALPVLVLTRQANRETTTDLWQRGADGVVLKPCSVNVLAKAMQLAVKRRRQRLAGAGVVDNPAGERDQSR